MTDAIKIFEMINNLDTTGTTEFTLESMKKIEECSNKIRSAIFLAHNINDKTSKAFIYNEANIKINALISRLNSYLAKFGIDKDLDIEEQIAVIIYKFVKQEEERQENFGSKIKDTAFSSAMAGMFFGPRMAISTALLDAAEHMNEEQIAELKYEDIKKLEVLNSLYTAVAMTLDMIESYLENLQQPQKR